MKLFYNCILFVLFVIPFTGYAQETVAQTENYAPDVIQRYHVLKSNYNIKEGLYQAFYKRKHIIASGFYVAGKRAGTWHFYDIDGKLVQNYNYDKKVFTFAAREDTAANIIKYEFVKKLNDTGWVSLPLRPGGILFGYLPYIKKFKIKDPDALRPDEECGVIQILVSPSGRLAECKLLIKHKKPLQMLNDEAVIESYLLDPAELKDDEKEFLPATSDHQPVSVVIYIYCNIRPNGTLSLY